MAAPHLNLNSNITEVLVIPGGLFLEVILDMPMSRSFHSSEKSSDNAQNLDGLLSNFHSLFTLLIWHDQVGFFFTTSSEFNIFSPQKLLRCLVNPLSSLNWTLSINPSRSYQACYQNIAIGPEYNCTPADFSDHLIAVFLPMAPCRCLHQI